MQTNNRESDRVSLGDYNLYLKRISPWLEDSEVRVDVRTFRLEKVQEEGFLLETAQEEVVELDREEIRVTEDEGEIVASLSFELDDLVCASSPQTTVQRRGRRALDLGSHGSFSFEIDPHANSDVTPERKDVERVHTNAGKRIGEKIKQVGVIGAAAAGVLALTFRH